MSIEPTSASLTRAHDLIGDIWQFWVREWASIAREAKSKLLPQQVPLTSIQFAESSIVVQRTDRLSPNVIAICDEGTSPVSALRLETAGTKDAEIVLPGSEVLRPRLRMPRAPRAVLRKALHFELARLSPIDPDQLYFDFALSSASSATEWDVQLRAIRRSVVDATVARCRAAGLRVARIRLGTDPQPADWRVFPIDRTALAISEWGRLKAVALAGLAVLLLLATLVAAHGRGSAAAARISDAIGIARAQASTVEHLRAEIRAFAKEQSVLWTLKGQPLLVSTLSEVTRALPDDTWLSDLQVTGRKVRIQGFSRSASHLVSEIDSGHEFSNAQFQAPLTQDSATKSVRFDLSFEVRK